MRRLEDTLLACRKSNLFHSPKNFQMQIHWVLICWSDYLHLILKIVQQLKRLIFIYLDNYQRRNLFECTKWWSIMQIISKVPYFFVMPVFAGTKRSLFPWFVKCGPWTVVHSTHFKARVWVWEEKIGQRWC